MTKEDLPNKNLHRQVKSVRRTFSNPEQKERYLYSRRISRKENEQAKIYAQAFTMDMIDFLWIDTEGKLDILGADEHQRKLLPVLFNSSKTFGTPNDGALRVVRTFGKIDYRNKPFLVREFKNVSDWLESEDELTDIKERIHDKLRPPFSIVTRWGFDDGFSPTLSFMGSGPVYFTTDLAFIAPPKKLETPEDATYYCQSLAPMTSRTVNDLSSDGNVLIRRHVGEEQLRESVRTEEWHYLGVLNSGRIPREYHIYGMYDNIGLMRK